MVGPFTRVLETRENEEMLKDVGLPCQKVCKRYRDEACLYVDRCFHASSLPCLHITVRQCM